MVAGFNISYFPNSPILYQFHLYIFIFGQMASKFSDISSDQVKAQKNRLIAARDLDESEKRMYIKVFTMH